MLLSRTGQHLSASNGRSQNKVGWCSVTHSAPPAASLVSSSSAARPWHGCLLPCPSRQQAITSGNDHRVVATASLPPSLEAPCAVVSAAVRFYHVSETNDFKDFSKVVSPDVKWRQRGLLQGKQTHVGAEAVHDALLHLHAAYQDLTYTVINYAEEEERVVVFWTAVGTNRQSLFGMPASFKKSTFSGVSLVSLDSEGRISEVIEYRQPTHEEMEAHLRRDLPGPQRATIERLLLRGHANPASTSGSSSAAGGSYCQIPSSREIDPMWRVRAVQAATEWVENWTPGPDLENMVRDDIEEFNIYSWPDFEQDFVGRDALEERRSRNSQDAVVIRETIADSTTNVVAVHWFDFEQAPSLAAPGAAFTPPSTAHPVAAAAAPKAAAAGMPDEAIPRQQPTLHPEHGSVELKNGHLRVHLSPASTLRKSLGSEDDVGGGLGFVGPRLHKFRGVTLFRLDDNCKLAWLVTFRELKATELDTYLLQPQQAEATAAVGK